MAERIRVDFNTMNRWESFKGSDAPEDRRVRIPPSSVKPEFRPGMRVTLFEEGLEVEAILEWDEEGNIHSWWAKPDPSTWRDLPSTYDPGILGKAIVSEHDDTLVWLLTHKSYSDPVARTADVHPGERSLELEYEEVRTYLARTRTPDLASRIAMALNRVLDGEDVEVTWEAGDFVHRCRFEPHLNEVVARDWRRSGNWPARFPDEAGAAETARRLNAVLCDPLEDSPADPPPSR